MRARRTRLTAWEGKETRCAPAGDALDRTDDLQHRVAGAVAEYERRTRSALHQSVERQKVRLAQVEDVNVVADAGAVRGVEVAAE